MQMEEICCGRVHLLARPDNSIDYEYAPIFSMDLFSETENTEKKSPPIFFRLIFIFNSRLPLITRRVHRKWQNYYYDLNEWTESKVCEARDEQETMFSKPDEYLNSEIHKYVIQLLLFVGKIEMRWLSSFLCLFTIRARIHSFIIQF